MKSLLIIIMVAALTGVLLPDAAPDFGQSHHLFSATSTSTQSQDKNPCNEKETFCWYGPFQDGSDEVDAWGNQWKADDPTEKPLKQVTEVRCVKRLRVCIHARNQQTVGGSMTNIDLYNVRLWTNLKIEAVLDETADAMCEEDKLVLNRAERSAIRISSPGPGANDKRCTALIPAPKTVIYRLHD